MTPNTSHTSNQTNVGQACATSYLNTLKPPKVFLVQQGFRTGRHLSACARPVVHHCLSSEVTLPHIKHVKPSPPLAIPFRPCESSFSIKGSSLSVLHLPPTLYAQGEVPERGMGQGERLRERSKAKRAKWRFSLSTSSSDVLCMSKATEATVVVLGAMGPTGVFRSWAALAYIRSISNIVATPAAFMLFPLSRRSEVPLYLTMPSTPASRRSPRN